MTEQKQVEIKDPHLGSLASIALEHASTLGGTSGQVISDHIQNCAVTINGYIEQLHTANNELMALRKEG